MEQIMNRRQFLASAAAAGSLPLDLRQLRGDQQSDGLTFATPDAARKSPPEKFGYVMGVYAGTQIKKPDYLATINLDPASTTYSQVIHRLPMPNVGDELHHFGWNACASCQGQRARRYLVIPGLISGRIHIVDAGTPVKTQAAQGHRTRRDRSQDQTHGAAHGPLPPRWPDHDFDVGRRQAHGAGRLSVAQ
jgi:hypothetical protein